MSIEPIEAIKKAIAKFPKLTAFGFGVFNEAALSTEECNIEFRKEREEMFSPISLVQFQKSCDWLSRQKRTKGVNPRAGSSYGLKKHMIEEGVGYVTNGMFIAAAIASGFKVVPAWLGSPNAFLNISKKLQLT